MVTVLLSRIRTESQTASTGTLTGVTLDPSGATVAGVVVRLVNQVTGTTVSSISDGEGRFGFPLLSPGGYEVQATTPPSNALLGSTTVSISVTETLHLDLHLR